MSDSKLTIRLTKEEQELATRIGRDVMRVIMQHEPPPWVAYKVGEALHHAMRETFATQCLGLKAS